MIENQDVRTIENGFSMMGTSLDQHFERLGGQLAAQHNEVLSTLKTTSAGISNIEAVQKLQNSLSANISQSSIESGKHLKNIQEYVYLCR